MEVGGNRSSIYGRHRQSSCERLVALVLGVLAVLSPLFVDRKTTCTEELELEEQSTLITISSCLPILILVLVIALALLSYFDNSFTSIDPYLIFRIGGSSAGIIMLLILLALVLKCKSLEV